MVLGEGPSKQEKHSKRRRRIKPTLIDGVIKLAVYTEALQSDDPEVRRLPFNREVRTGLLEGSIVDTQLWSPSPLDPALLAYKQADAGEWIGYDFNRRKEFRRRRVLHKQRPMGEMLVLDIKEIEAREPSHLTPTRAFPIFNSENSSQLTALPIEVMVEKGFLEQRTYEDAFAAVGLDGKYAAQLDGIREQLVYTVTPKGNTLVHLEKALGQFIQAPENKTSPVRKGLIFPSPLPA